MAKRKVQANGGRTGLGLVVGMLIAAIVLLTVIFSLGVVEGKQGANGNIQAPKIEAPKAE